MSDERYTTLERMFAEINAKLATYHDNTMSLTGDFRLVNQKLDSISCTVEEINTHAKITNGRVNSLETSRGWNKGWMAGISCSIIVIVGLITFVGNVFYGQLNNLLNMHIKANLANVVNAQTK